jgi:pimeloyl-ACP methyl ester carboxylesterase
MIEEIGRVNMNSPPDLKMFYHEQHKQSSKPTILFIHGLFSSHLEWMNVTSFLTDYNLVAVDLPGHSRSKEIPFSFENSVNALYGLITRKGLIGKVHIVGLSLGGFVTLELARRYPGAASSVFASGATPLRGYQKWLAERPRVLHPLLNMVENGVPDSWYWWLCRKTGAWYSHMCSRCEYVDLFTTVLQVFCDMMICTPKSN